MLGNKLKLLREHNGLTQKQVGLALGLSEGRYNQYELDKRSPDYSVIKDIANYYNVTIDFLLDNDVKEKSKLEENIREKEILKKALVNAGYITDDEELDWDDFVKILKFAKQIKEFINDYSKN